MSAGPTRGVSGRVTSPDDVRPFNDPVLVLEGGFCLARVAPVKSHRHAFFVSGDMPPRPSFSS